MSKNNLIQKEIFLKKILIQKVGKSKLDKLSNQ